MHTVDVLRQPERAEEIGASGQCFIHKVCGYDVVTHKVGNLVTPKLLRPAPWYARLRLLAFRLPRALVLCVPLSARPWIGRLWNVVARRR